MTLTMPRAIGIAAVMLLGAALASAAWTKTTTHFTTGIVVASCGTPPTVTLSSGWSYAVNHQAPITLDTNGYLCASPAGPPPVACAVNFSFDGSDTTGCFAISTMVER